MKFPNPAYLTHPNIPKPLHGVNPRTIMGKEWWDEKRQEAYATHDYHCWACGVHKQDAEYHQWLEAHEEYDIDYKTGRVELKGIIALCHSCHNFIHSGRMMILLQKGEMSKEKVIDILGHGFQVLDREKLEAFWVADYLWSILFDEEFDAPKVDESNDAKWSDWHLVIDGKKYYTPYKNIEEWAEAYNR